MLIAITIRYWKYGMKETSNVTAVMYEIHFLMMIGILDEHSKDFCYMKIYEVMKIGTLIFREQNAVFTKLTKIHYKVLIKAD